MIVHRNGIYLFWQTDSYLSNWHLQTPYVLDDIQFATSEHGMMYEKACLFDPSAVDAILDAEHPRDVKKLGRAIKNYNDEEWAANSYELFLPHLVAKFRQNPLALAELESTGSDLIAEASPYDRIWGIGMRPEDPRALDPDKWDGENRLGKVLMRARSLV